MRKFLRKTQKIGAPTSALRNASKSSSSNSESSSPSSRDVSEERSGRSFYSENEKEIDRLKKRSLKDTARIRSSKMLSRAGNKNKITALALEKITFTGELPTTPLKHKSQAKSRSDQEFTKILTQKVP